MNIIRTIFGFVIAIALIGFAVSNRQIIPLIYSPLHDPLDLPLYLVALLFMAGGFVLGAFTLWLNSAPLRRTKRQQRKKIKGLEKELEGQNKTPDKAKTPPSEFFPALPHAQNSSIK